MLASVIINNYNYGSFLEDAIRSVLRQSYAHVELLVVDDGSTDCSRDIIEQYRDRVHPILKENGGQASAFNAGFAASHGEVILFLDADDVLWPDTVERVVGAFRTNQSAAKVQYRLVVVDAQGRPTGPTTPPTHVRLWSGDLRAQMLCFPDDIPSPPTSGNAFAARVLRSILPIPEDVYGSILADLYLHNLAPLYGGVISLDAPGGYYRVHGRNLHYQATLDLHRIQQIIVRTAYGHRVIARHAEQLGLATQSKMGEFLSVTDIANRLVSLRWDAAKHPLPGDTRWTLLRLGVRAARRRYDLAWPTKVAYGAWFVCVALAPWYVARRMAAYAFNPHR